MKGTLLFDNALSPITVCQDFFLVISMNVQCKWFLGYILKCCVFWESTDFEFLVFLYKSIF